MIEVRCGGCGKTLKAQEGMAGKRAKCRACGKVVEVPEPWMPPGVGVVDDDPDKPATKPQKPQPIQPAPQRPTPMPKPQPSWMHTGGPTYAPARKWSAADQFFRAAGIAAVCTAGFFLLICSGDFRVRDAGCREDGTSACRPCTQMNVRPHSPQQKRFSSPEEEAAFTRKSRRWDSVLRNDNDLAGSDRCRGSGRLGVGSAGQFGRSRQGTARSSQRLTDGYRAATLRENGITPEQWDLIWTEGISMALPLPKYPSFDIGMRRKNSQSPEWSSQEQHLSPH